MRLWHYKIIPYLPDSQLIAQWRELNTIFTKQPNHILINYVYEYPKEDLLAYTYKVIHEMLTRNMNIKSLENSNKYFENNGCEEYISAYKYLKQDFENPIITVKYHEPFPNHHTNRYLWQCFANLQEKYDRGQRDFDKNRYLKLEEFVKNEIH